MRSLESAARSAPPDAHPATLLSFLTWCCETTPKDGSGGNPPERRATRCRVRLCSQPLRGANDDRSLLLDHTERSQDHDVPGGSFPPLPHRSREYRKRCPVRACVPQDLA